MVCVRCVLVCVDNTGGLHAHASTPRVESGERARVICRRKTTSFSCRVGDSEWIPLVTEGDSSCSCVHQTHSVNVFFNMLTFFHSSFGICSFSGVWQLRWMESTSLIIKWLVTKTTLVRVCLFPGKHIVCLISVLIHFNFLNRIFVVLHNYRSLEL